MMSGAYLYITRGESYQFRTAVALDGAPVDLDGVSLWFLAQQEEIDGLQNNVIFNVNSQAGAIVVSGNNNNVVTVTLNASLTANFLRSNAARWALRCLTANAQVYTLDRGQIAIEDPIR